MGKDVLINHLEALDGIVGSVHAVGACEQGLSWARPLTMT